MKKHRFDSERRSFFAQSILAGLAVFLAKPWQSAMVFADGAALPQLDESNPTAKALGYQLNADKVDPKKWPKRSGADAKQQRCSTCMFYTAIDKKSGKSQIFPTNSVKAEAWCNSWSKKA